jgi:hypothetical protein
MKKTSLVIALSLLQIETSTSFAEAWDYICKVTTAPGRYVGKAYPLHIDDGKKCATFQGKRYSIIKSSADDGPIGNGPQGEEECAKFCWDVKGSDHSFRIGTATQGVAYFRQDDEEWDCDMLGYKKRR